MPTKAEKLKAAHDGRIWFELPDPHGDKEYAERQCDCANAVLRSMFGEKTPHKFWYHSEKNRYCFVTSEAGTYLECADRGQWFAFESMIAKKD